MRHVFCAAFAAALLSGSATAAIAITSRTSYAYYKSVEQYGFNAPTVTQGEDTKTGVGTKTVSTPGAGFTSTVNESGITMTHMSGKVEGRSSIDYSISTIKRMTLEVGMSVTGAGAKIDVLMNAHLAGVSSGNNPEGRNVYMVIYNTATNAVVFDSINIVTGYISSFVPEQYWTNAAWSGTIGPGSYRVAIGTNGNVSELLGPGAGWRGTGDLDASLTFTAIVPSPATLPLFAPLLVISRRRRA